MTPEDHDIPDWARRERQGDLGWIAENLDTLSAIASVAFEGEGRGIIVVDTTIRPMPGAGHPFAYFSQETIEEQDDEDITRMVAEYAPAQEFVIVRLKPDDRTSTYRVGVVPPGPQEAVARENIPGHTDDQAAAPELSPPDKRLRRRLDECNQRQPAQDRGGGQCGAGDPDVAARAQKGRADA